MAKLSTIAESSSEPRRVIQGFSVLELAAVVAVLAILAGISMPAFLNLIKSARVDAVKSQLNSLISKCLSNARDEDFDLESIIDDPSILGFESNGYKLSPESNTCKSFELIPADDEDIYSFSMGFSVYKDKNNNTAVSKFATPSKSSDAYSSCLKWAGSNCTADDALKKKWEDEARIADLKKTCNEDFYTFLNSGSKGQKNVWDDTSQTCSRPQWVLDGTRYTSKDAYDSAFTAKVGKECIEELATYATNSPRNGLYTNERCGIDTYFLNGINLETNDPIIYQAKAKEYNDLECAAAEQQWLSSADNTFTWPSNISCIEKWKCGNTIYTDEAKYISSSCGTPLPKKEDKENSCRVWYKGKCKA